MSTNEFLKFLEPELTEVIVEGDGLDLDLSTWIGILNTRLRRRLEELERQAKIK